MNLNGEKMKEKLNSVQIRIKNVQKVFIMYIKHVLSMIILTYKTALTATNIVLKRVKVKETKIKKYHKIVCI